MQSENKPLAGAVGTTKTFKQRIKERKECALTDDTLRQANQRLEAMKESNK